MRQELKQNLKLYTEVSIEYVKGKEDREAIVRGEDTQLTVMSLSNFSLASFLP